MARARPRAVPSPTQREGHRGEARAERYLVERGYSIVARNWREGRAELDLVAREGEVLVFVEVRSRRSAEAGRPAETIGARKQRHVARAALLYLSRARPSLAGGVRFDVVEVLDGAEGAQIVLTRAAFDGASLYGAQAGPTL